MNAPLSDDLLQQLRADGLPRMAAQLGLPQHQVDDAVAAALPLLLGAMGRNASQPAGAEALFGALARDHRGLDPGNVLGTVLSGGAAGDGAGILGHVLGNRTPAAAQALGGIGGIGQDRAGMLLRMLAPVVLAYLARRMFAPPEAKAATMPPPSPQGLGEILAGEREQIRDRPGAGGLLSILDRDHDGDVDLQDFLRRNDAGLGVQSAEMRSPRPLL